MTDADWTRVSALLDELFDLDAAACAARLAQIAGDDPALAARLQKMLDADAVSGLLDEGIARVAPTVMERLSDAETDTSHVGSSAALAGRQLGHYRLVERIGAGGMGEVWRGERVDDFEQAVAIKLIRPLMDSPALRERFSRERRILARLDHPNIARLLDGGVAEDGTPWYAMEFVRGEDIVSHAQQHELDARARVELLLQVCDATAQAQSLLIVHRDLKPSNLLVDGAGRVRVLDFGIARLLDDSLESRLTGTGIRVYSPAYAAPEQIRGDAVGTAADVFALGAVLFELLTGAPPHPQRSAAPERLLAGLEHETAPRPSQSLRERSRETGELRASQFARELDSDLDLIVATALHPDPARRYAGAAQLADDLRRWLDGRPIAARADTAGYRMRRFVTRHRLAVGSASAVLLALVAGLGMALWQGSVAREQAARADAEAQRAEAEAAQARGQAERTRKVKEFLVSIFVPVDPLQRGEDAPQTLEQAFDAALARARDELSDDPILQADVLDDFGEILANRGNLDDAAALFEQAIHVAESAYGPTHPVLAESLINRAMVAYMGGHAKAALPDIERAVSILEADDGGDPLALPVALNGLAVLRNAIGDANGAREASRRVLTAFRERAPGHPRMIQALSNEAFTALAQGERDHAESLLEEAEALVLQHFGEASPTLWPILDNRANIAYQRGDIAAQEALTRRALKLAETNFPGDHKWVAQSMADLGKQQARSGNLDEAEATLRAALAMMQRLADPGDQPIAGDGLAQVQAKRGDLEAAMTTLDKALGGCIETQSENAADCLLIRGHRAAMLAVAGRAAEGLTEADAALGALGEDARLFEQRSEIHLARATALAKLGRRDEALAAQNQAIALLRDGFGPEHPLTRQAQAATAAP